jgi:hypothetical protein
VPFRLCILFSPILFFYCGVIRMTKFLISTSVLAVGAVVYQRRTSYGTASKELREPARPDGQPVNLSPEGKGLSPATDISGGAI